MTIDLQPANPSSKITVAVLSDNIFSIFDATTVDADSVLFGKTGTEAAELHRDKNGNARRHVEDVNGDGLPDMVFHFQVADTDFGCDDIPDGQKSVVLPAKLTGATQGGTPILGEGNLRLLGGGKDPSD